MFLYSKWNGSTTYNHAENKRDFGTGTFYNSKINLFILNLFLLGRRSI